MERTPNPVIRLLLAATYVFACMGFGIHTCHEDGSRHFVWMLGNVSCEEIHHHSHGADHDHHHETGCCSTHIYVLTDAQDTDAGDVRLAAPPCTGSFLAETSAPLPSFAGHHTPYATDSPPPVRSLSRSLISIWLI